MAKDAQAELKKALEAVEKKLGKGAIHRASESASVYHLAFRNPTLNYATEGGVPWNRFTSMAGEESTGKTLALFELYSMAQRLPGSMDPLLRRRIEYHRGHGHDKVVARLQDELDWIHDTFPEGARCCHYDIEAQFDKRRAAKVGVDLDALYLVETNVIEEICGALMTLFGHYHVHGLDSTSNAGSVLRFKEEPGKSLVGTEARQWKYSLMQAQSFFGPLHNGTGIPNMLVMIHQMSMNVKSGGMQQATGKYVKFVSSCSIRFSRGSFLWNKKGVLLGEKSAAYGSAEAADAVSMAGRAEADGVEVYAQIEKSRTCRPFRTAGLQFNYRSLQYVVVHELATAGIYFGLIEKSGTWYKVAGEEKNLGQGLLPVYQRLADDEELRDMICCRLLDFTGESDEIDLERAKMEKLAKDKELVVVEEPSNDAIERARRAVQAA